MEPLRKVLRQAHRTAWRTKAVHGRPGDGMKTIALDGHERFWGTARCGPEGRVRDVEVKDRTVRPYDHRVVVAQGGGVTPPGILDVEPIRPGEGEVVAAGRLWERVVGDYGRLIDVVSLDEMYLEAPFLKKGVAAGKPFVGVMKQEARDRYQDADHRRRTLAPQVMGEGSKTSRIWDLENRGFNERAGLGNMDPCFVHEPRAIEVILLTLAVAFLTTYLFFERTLKPERRRHLTRLGLAGRVAEDLAPVPLQPSG